MKCQEANVSKDHIYAVLIKKFHTNKRAWAIFPNQRTGVDFTADNARRIDLFVFKTGMGSTKSYKQFDRISYRVILDQKELDADKKMRLRQRPAKLLSTYFYYVAPSGLIPIVELPVDSGLIELREKDLMPTIRYPSPKNDNGPTWQFVGALLKQSLSKD